MGEPPGVSRRRPRKEGGMKNSECKMQNANIEHSIPARRETPNVETNSGGPALAGSLVPPYNSATTGQPPSLTRRAFNFATCLLFTD